MSGRLKAYEQTLDNAKNKKIFANTELQRVEPPEQLQKLGRLNENNSGFLKSKGDTSKSKFTRRGVDVQQIIDNNVNVGSFGAGATQNPQVGSFGSYYKTSGKNAEPQLEPIGAGQTANVLAGLDAVKTNRLHDFAPVNYLMTLSCISIPKFNTGSGLESVILKSGGKGFQGVGNLNSDFYVDNVVIRNTVAPNEMSGMGNVFQLMFDVIEPYGTSFIDGLIQAAGEQGYISHLQAVYNLKIEFKGNNDNGQPTNFIPKTTRNIPIHIYAVEMKIEAGVTTYQLQCVPATHLAQTDIYSHIQESITCTGDTVGDLIENFLNTYSKSLKNLQSSTNPKLKLTDEYFLDRTQSMEEILKSPIGYTDSSALANIVTVSNIYDTATSKNFRSVKVPKGTKIQTFIDAVIKESRFYKDQLNISGKPDTKTIKVHKVETQLQIGSDNGNGRNQYKFVYIVRKQDFTAELADPKSDTSDMVEPVRIYNYLYTGQNSDVLDFDISYKFSYYQTIPYLQDKGNDNLTDAGDGQQNKNVSEESKTQGSSSEGIAGEVLNQKQSSFINGINDENSEAVDIMLQIIQNPTADLLVTNIEIIGDPYWIGQKGVSNLSFVDSFTDIPNEDAVGAVATDESQIVVEINFKFPTDLDDAQGIFKNIKDSQGFAGRYRVYMCEHRFAGGMYTTVLQMIRMKNQPKEISSQIGQSANSLGSATYSNDQGNLITPQVGSFGTGATSVSNPQVGSFGESDSYVTGQTTNNVTRVPVGSNITRQFTGANRGGFVPEGFDVTDRLPYPKIDIEFTGNKPYYYTKQQLDLIREIGATPEKSRINPDGY